MAANLDFQGEKLDRFSFVFLRRRQNSGSISSVKKNWLNFWISYGAFRTRASDDAFEKKCQDCGLMIVLDERGGEGSRFLQIAPVHNRKIKETFFEMPKGCEPSKAFRRWGEEGDCTCLGFVLGCFRSNWRT